MGQCRCCRMEERGISNIIGYCAECIKTHFETVWPEIRKIHERSRSVYGLPLWPPYSEQEPTCQLCFHQCRPRENLFGYCGLRRVAGAHMIGGRPPEGSLSYYFDPLPTNCVADFVCPEGTASTGGENTYGFQRKPKSFNLAVFYQACNFNCLYCQNYHFKKATKSLHFTPAADLAQAVTENTACICFFGGDPTPQILHALKTAYLALKTTNRGRLRICWETNGSANEKYIRRMAELSLRSGGCVKIDLKAFDEQLHLALCGVGNQPVLANFKALAGMIGRRPEPPLLVASTPLVPGYVDEEEVRHIAAFIHALNPEIPYRLLGFYPHFKLIDLPTTSYVQAERCLKAARGVGLKHVEIGNRGLLSYE